MGLGTRIRAPGGRSRRGHVSVGLRCVQWGHDVWAARGFDGIIGSTEGEAGDDGDACTDGDVCGPMGACLPRACVCGPDTCGCAWAANVCEACAAASKGGWSPVAVGSPCADGLDGTSGEACDDDVRQLASDSDEMLLMGSWWTSEVGGFGLQAPSVWRWHVP